MRIAAGVEYLGSRYRGWQLQPDVPTIQGKVEKALGRIADRPVHVVCAGRTDAGVHAVGQVVHFDTAAERGETAWVFGANSDLPGDISLRWARPVGEAFHARFSARARRYRYIIHNARSRSATLAESAAWFRQPLDSELMHAAGQSLLGEHDFSAFRAAGCQARTPWRHVYAVSAHRCGDLVIVDVEANAFLHHMVRNIAGVLLAIGCGEQPMAWANFVLHSRDRRCGGVNAPARGLYFKQVLYPATYGLDDLCPTHPLMQI
jgi:tRNA pseudouridine38-40 synthase